MNLRIYLCQNDSNGNLTEELSMVTVEVGSEIVATLETVDMLPRKCKVTDRLIELSNGTVKHPGITVMVGNVHWNSYEMIDHYALGLIQLLQLSKEWRCMEGWETVFEKFGKGETITGFDLDLPEDVQPVVFARNQLGLKL